MDPAARDALAGFVRDQVRVELVAELERLSELAERVETLEGMVCPVSYSAEAVVDRRRQAARELRRRGLSNAAIAKRLGIARSTVQQDIRGVARPTTVTGRDGRAHATAVGFVVGNGNRPGA
jgi:ATP/maltotriose-dependent transcriptional regulator MalT